MSNDFRYMGTPRYRRKGINFSSLFQDENESLISPASTLSTSRANYNHHDNILNYQLPCAKPLLCRHEPNINEEIVVDDYKQKLKSLNSLLSPIQLFHDIDLMIKNYHTLKKEYCLQWELQQLYRQQIRSLLKQKKGTPKNNDHLSYIMPLQDIELLIQRLQNIQFSISEIFQNCVNKKKSRKSPTKNAKIMSPKIRKKNVMSPKLRRKLSRCGSDAYQLTKRKKTKHKIKTKTDKCVKYKKYDSFSPLILPYNINTTIRRRLSVRSFGSLYSDEFRNSVAINYKKRMSLHDEFKHHDDFLGLRQLQTVEFYHDDYIGQHEVFDSPFGVRPIIYCDWTASGKPLYCVEKYLSSEMLTLYANTHTTTSITGVQTSKFRSEARSIILESVGGDYNEDVVIFTGNGATAAIYKIANVLMQQKGYKPSSTIVFISIYEHNSNIFIWKELGCKVIVIPESDSYDRGGLDLKILEKHLRFYTCLHLKHKYNLLIGSFSAASNVSGVVAPIDECTELLHRYNALSFWDYATAAPYVHINMTNKQNPMLSKDAVFISPHKYLGGPGSPGILCAKKRLFLNYTPVVAGGGTVFIAYGVEDGEWEYLDNIEEREEGGTPNIIGSVRAAFAFMVKDHLTTEFIQHRERQYLQYFLQECETIPNLIIMGNTKYDRLPVISFLITHTKKGFGAAKKTKYLHYNFIAALMNDLFGIQGRGGCACAGMYGKYVLNMNMDQVDHIVEQLRLNKNELSRPGYFRINLHYTLNTNELNYIINAIKFVCKKGWLFVSLYDVDPQTGNFFYRDNKLFKQELRSLLDISFNTNQMKYKKKAKTNANINLNKYFEIANNIILNLNQYLPTIKQFKNEKKICDQIAWYWLPSELCQDAKNYQQNK